MDNAVAVADVQVGVAAAGALALEVVGGARVGVVVVAGAGALGPRFTEDSSDFLALLGVRETRAAVAAPHRRGESSRAHGAHSHDRVCRARRARPRARLGNVARSRRGAARFARGFERALRRARAGALLAAHIENGALSLALEHARRVVAAGVDLGARQRAAVALLARLADPVAAHGGAPCVGRDVLQALRHRILLDVVLEILLRADRPRSRKVRRRRRVHHVRGGAWARRRHAFRRVRCVCVRHPEVVPELVPHDGRDRTVGGCFPCAHVVRGERRRRIHIYIYIYVLLIIFPIVCLAIYS